MDTEAKRSGSITFLLVGLVLLATAAGFVFCCVPLVYCRCCAGSELHIRPVAFSYDELVACTACRGGKRTFFNKWLGPVPTESWKIPNAGIPDEKFKLPEEKK